MRRLLPTLALTAALAACSAPPAAVAPTSTPAPTATPAPTSTPAPTATAPPAPTSTPRPTATAAPTGIAAPTSTATGDAGAQAGATAALEDALRRTAAVETYSAEIGLTGSGFAAAPPGVTADLLTMAGRFDGAEHEFTAGGFLAVFMGADPAAGLQAVRAGGASYLKGPMALIGAAEPVWYRLPPERAALAEPPVSPATLRGVLTQIDVAGAQLTAGEPVARGGLQCTPYAGGTATTVALLRDLYQGGLPALVAPEQVQEGQTTLLVCEDGFLHQLTMGLRGAFPGSEPAPFSLDLAAQLADFDGAISITAPSGARELPAAPGATP